MKKYIVMDSGVYIEEGYKFQNELIFECGNPPYTTNTWHIVKDEEDYKKYCDILDNCEVEYCTTDENPESCVI